MFQDQPRGSKTGRTVTLTELELLAAQRLLERLVAAEPQHVHLESPHPSRAAEIDRIAFVELAREIFENRRRRSAVFGTSMFGEAAWDMLLALYILDTSGGRQTVGGLMSQSGAPSTTAIRWLGFLVSRGFARREEHPTDRRSAFVSLTDEGRTKMDEYFSGTVRTAM